jgi:AGCS family alanine or glycine:cation symporter
VGAASLTSQSFAETLGGGGEILVAVATALFAYSTILGWSYYGEKAIEYLANSLGGPRATRHAIHGYRLVFTAVVMVGALMQLEFVWNFSDLANGLMAIPNLIALLLLSKVIKQETDRYFSTLK